MSSYVVNLSAIASSVAIFVFYQLDILAVQNAFFLAALIVGAYTGYQFAIREGMNVVEAARAVVANPGSYPRRTAYWAYVGSTAVGLFVIAQSLASA